MHLRPPSIDHGVISFLWAFGFAVFIWLGLRAVGVENAPAFVIACVSGFAIFLFVRVYGEEEPRRP
jgi:ABC-type multidrug transport system permease subunit